MDYLALAETQCSPTTVAEMRALTPNSMTEPQKLLDIFNPIIEQPACRGAALAYLLSEFPAKATPEYARELFGQTTLRSANLDASAKDTLAHLLGEIRIRDEWERGALFALIVYHVDRRDEFPVSSPEGPFGSTVFRESTSWNRSLYNANFGDSEALDNLAFMLDHETSADVINLMFRDILVIEPKVAKSLLAPFSQDQRPISTAKVGFQGPTLAMLVEIYTNTLP